jgi:hypothetical protein
MTPLQEELWAEASIRAIQSCGKTFPPDIAKFFYESQGRFERILRDGQTRKKGIIDDGRTGL